MNGFISVLLFTPNDLTEARRTRPERTMSGVVRGRDKVRPPHLTRETFSGRRPVDGADTLGGVFRPGENLTLGAEWKIKSADAA